MKLNHLKGHFTDNDEIENLVTDNGSSPQTGTSGSKNGKLKSTIGENNHSGGDRSAAKVLSCLRCGASFESLQE